MDSRRESRRVSSFHHIEKRGGCPQEMNSCQGKLFPKTGGERLNVYKLHRKTKVFYHYFLLKNGRTAFKIRDKKTVLWTVCAGSRQKGKRYLWN